MNLKNNQNKLPDLYSRVPIELNGIPLELLDPNNMSLSDFITCEICLNILLNPICCKNCKKKYCKNCIKSYFKNQNNNNQNRCPNCRQNFESSEIDQTTKDLFNVIKLKCFYHNNKCKEILIYDNFIKHINSCEKGEFKCNTKNCYFVGYLDDMIKHLYECGLKNIECKFCLNNYPKIIFDEHFEKCKNEIYPCIYCKEKMKKYKINEHEKTICLKYPIKCKNCGEKILRENLKSHLNNKFNCYENRIKKLEKQNYEKDEKIKKLFDKFNKLEIEFNKEKERNDNLEKNLKEIYFKVFDFNKINLNNKEKIYKNNFEDYENIKISNAIKNYRSLNNNNNNFNVNNEKKYNLNDINNVDNNFNKYKKLNYYKNPNPYEIKKMKTEKKENNFLYKKKKNIFLNKNEVFSLDEKKNFNLTDINNFYNK